MLRRVRSVPPFPGRAHLAMARRNPPLPRLRRARRARDAVRVPAAAGVDRGRTPMGDEAPTRRRVARNPMARPRLRKQATTPTPPTSPTVPLPSGRVVEVGPGEIGVGSPADPGGAENRVKTRPPALPSCCPRSRRSKSKNPNLFLSVTWRWKWAPRSRSSLSRPQSDWE